jgi:hypothetical protein
MKRIKECLEEYDLFFRWIDKQTYGLIEETKQVITINLELMVLEVFLHEYLHYRYPNWSERRVERETFRRIKKMPIRDINRYCHLIFKYGRTK